MRALRLADEAGAALRAVPSMCEARACRLRLALIRCEVAALFYRIGEAEAWLASARRHEAADANGPVDTVLAETHLAKARGERERERALDAAGRAVRASAPRADPARVAFIRAWLA